MVSDTRHQRVRDKKTQGAQEIACPFTLESQEQPCSVEIYRELLGSSIFDSVVGCLPLRHLSLAASAGGCTLHRSGTRRPGPQCHLMPIVTGQSDKGVQPDASKEDFFATTEDELVDLAHVLKRVLQLPLACIGLNAVSAFRV